MPLETGLSVLLLIKATRWLSDTPLYILICTTSSLSIPLLRLENKNIVPRGKGGGVRGIRGLGLTHMRTDTLYEIDKESEDLNLLYGTGYST